MSKRIFTKEQIKELLRNTNISRCSDKSITYSTDFKMLSIKQYYEEDLSPPQIFQEAGFDLRVIRRGTPKNCMQRWRKIYKLKGVDGLKTETRGINKKEIKVKDVTDKAKIERLEIEVAYLKAENDFLVKLRAKQKR